MDCVRSGDGSCILNAVFGKPHNQKQQTITSKISIRRWKMISTLLFSLQIVKRKLYSLFKLFECFALGACQSLNLNQRPKARLNFHKQGMCEAQSNLKGYFIWLNTTSDGLLTAHKQNYIVRVIKVHVNMLIDSVTIKEINLTPYTGRLRKS